METWEAIRTLRAVRRYEDRPIRPEDLEAIVDAGRRAPSSMNLQRWAFVTSTDRATLEALATLGPYTGHVGAAAATVALITPQGRDDDERESIAFDLGQAMQNMLLAAWDRGIGGSHASPADPHLAREVLGYPEGWRCDHLLALGYPLRPPAREGRRKPLADVLHRERW
ncbi:MAG TPA: nitroreductase family protein [Actinomycetota bacterium]|nr:nitroreductase family protein [Actinomycetota bacterium]